MSSLNRCIMMGNLGKDPEIRRTQSGSPVASFSIAMTDTWKDKATGERKEHTEWANIVVFNEGICGVVEKYLKKGSKVLIEGRYQTRKWQDKEGNDRWSTEVVIPQFGGSLTLCGDPQGRPAPSPDDYGTTRTKDPGMDRYRELGAGQPQPSQGRELVDDDIPF